MKAIIVALIIFASSINAVGQVTHGYNEDQRLEERASKCLDEPGCQKRVAKKSTELSRNQNERGWGGTLVGIAIVLIIFWFFGAKGKARRDKDQGVMLPQDDETPKQEPEKVSMPKINADADADAVSHSAAYSNNKGVRTCYCGAVMTYQKRSTVQVLRCDVCGRLSSVQ